MKIIISCVMLLAMTSVHSMEQWNVARRDSAAFASLMRFGSEHQQAKVTLAANSIVAAFASLSVLSQVVPALYSTMVYFSSLAQAKAIANDVNSDIPWLRESDKEKYLELVSEMSTEQLKEIKATYFLEEGKKNFTLDNNKYDMISVINALVNDTHDIFYNGATSFTHLKDVRVAKAAFSSNMAMYMRHYDLLCTLEHVVNAKIGRVVDIIPDSGNHINDYDRGYSKEDTLSMVMIGVKNDGSERANCRATAHIGDASLSYGMAVDCMSVAQSMPYFGWFELNDDGTAAKAIAESFGLSNLNYDPKIHVILRDKVCMGRNRQDPSQKFWMRPMMIDHHSEYVTFAAFDNSYLNSSLNRDRSREVISCFTMPDSSFAGFSEDFKASKRDGHAFGEVTSLTCGNGVFRSITITPDGVAHAALNVYYEYCFDYNKLVNYFLGIVGN